MCVCVAYGQLETNTRVRDVHVYVVTACDEIFFCLLILFNWNYLCSNLDLLNVKNSPPWKGKIIILTCMYYSLKFTCTLYLLELAEEEYKNVCPVHPSLPGCQQKLYLPYVQQLGMSAGSKIGVACWWQEGLEETGGCLQMFRCQCVLTCIIMKYLMPKDFIYLFIFIYLLIISIFCIDWTRHSGGKNKNHQPGNILSWFSSK